MANPLCLATLKRRLGITVDTYDVDLQVTLNAVWQTAVTWLGYDPQRQEYTQFFSGSNSGTFNLYLGSYPVVTDSVVVYVDPLGYYGVPPEAFGTEALWEPGVDYVVRTDEGTRSGILYAINQPWPYTYSVLPQNLAAERDICAGCVKVVYEAGLTDAEMAGITNALLTEAAADFRSQATGFGAILSDSMDGASVTVSQFQNKGVFGGVNPWTSPLTAGKLQLFRRIPIGRL